MIDTQAIKIKPDRPPGADQSHLPHVSGDQRVAAAIAETQAEARHLAILKKIAQLNNHWNWFSRAWHFTQDNWSTISAGLSIAGLGVCIIASAGVCMIVGAGIAVANYAHNAYVAHDPLDPSALRTFGWDLLTTAAFGYLAKGATAGFSVAPTGERAGVGEGWSLTKGWLESPRVKVGVMRNKYGKLEAVDGAARRAGPRHGSRYAFGVSAENFFINAVASVPAAGVQIVGENYTPRDEWLP